MISENQRKYLEEVHRLKDVIITPGLYTHKNSNRFTYEVLTVDEPNNCVLLLTKDNQKTTKTLHWCKKYLVKQ